MTDRDMFRLMLAPFQIMYAMLMFCIGTLKLITRTGSRAHHAHKRLKAATTKELRCPMGCDPQPADSAWACASCGAKRVGFVWSECPACKTIAAYVDCETCGHAIVNPVA